MNERHPSIDVFSYLGPLCVKLLHDAGLPIYGNRIAVLCDNAFGPYIMQALKGLGGLVTSFEGAGALTSNAWDCVVVALKPRSKPRLDGEEVIRLAGVAPGAVVAQFWGDIDRDALSSEGIPVWPRARPSLDTWPSSVRAWT